YGNNFPNVTGNNNLVMNPGIYIITSGGFNFNSSGYLQAFDVLLYDAGTGSSDGISLTGGGGGTFTPVPGSVSGTFPSGNQVVWTPYGIPYTNLNTGTSVDATTALTFVDDNGTTHTPGFSQYAGFSIWTNRVAPPQGQGTSLGAPVSITGNGT